MPDSMTPEEIRAAARELARATREAAKEAERAAKAAARETERAAKAAAREIENAAKAAAKETDKAAKEAAKAEADAARARATQQAQRVRATQDAAHAMQSLTAGVQHLFRGNIGGAVSSLAQGAKAVGTTLSAASKSEAAAGAEGAAEASEALAAGLAEAALPLAAVTAAAALVAAGLKAVYDTAEQAARALKMVYDAALLSGGSAGDIAGLSRFGLGPAEAGQLANAFRRATEPGSSPEALLALSKLGMSPQAPAAFGGPVNNAALLNQALERLRDLPRDTQIRVAGSIPGLEQVLARLNVSPAVRAAQQANEGLGRQVNTEGATRQANDFSEALRLVGAQFDLVKTAAGKGALQPILEGLLDLAGALGQLAETLNAHPEIGEFFGKIVKFFLDSAAGNVQLLSDGLKWITSLKTGFMAFLEDSYKFLQVIVEMTRGLVSSLTLGAVNLPGLPNLPKGGGGVSGGVDDALNRNTNALLDNTRWMREQINGGGDRVRGAQPAGLRGQALSEWLKTQKIALGAFSL